MMPGPVMSEGPVPVPPGPVGHAPVSAGVCFVPPEPVPVMSVPVLQSQPVTVTVSMPQAEEPVPVSMAQPQPERLAS